MTASTIDSYQLRKVLQSTPHITTLDLEFEDEERNYDSILHMLTLDHQSTAVPDHIIPSLHTFSTHIQRECWDPNDYEEREPFSASSLESFIESRLASRNEGDAIQQAGRNLRRIVVVAYREKDLGAQRKFVQVLNRFTPRDLDLELKVKMVHEWTMMVPEVSGWVEVVDVH